MPREPKFKEVRKRCKRVKKTNCSLNNNQNFMSNTYGCGSPCGTSSCNTPKSEFCPPKGSILYYTGESDKCSDDGCKVTYLLPNTDEDKKYLTSYTNENGIQIFKWESISGTGGEVDADDVLNFCTKVGTCLTETPITSSQIANGSITNEKLANNSVTTDKIANGTITNEDISSSANISLTKLDFNNIPDAFCQAVANCGGGSGFTCNDLDDCLKVKSGFGDGKVLSVSGTNIVWSTPSGGTPETPRQPEFFQNLTAGSTVALSSAVASGTIIQVFRNGELWHPQGSAPDMTWSISGTTITFSEPFGNSVNGSSPERVAVYFIKS